MPKIAADLVRITLCYGDACEHRFWLKEFMLDRHSLRSTPVTLVFQCKEQSCVWAPAGDRQPMMLACVPLIYDTRTTLLICLSCQSQSGQWCIWLMTPGFVILPSWFLYAPSVVMVTTWSKAYQTVVMPDMPFLPDLLTSDSLCFPNLCLWAHTHALLSGHGFHTNWWTTHGLKLHPQGETPLHLQFPLTCWQSL